MGGHGFSPHLAATTVWVWSLCPQPARAEDASEQQRGLPPPALLLHVAVPPRGSKEDREAAGARAAFVNIPHSSCWGRQGAQGAAGGCTGAGHMPWQPCKLIFWM